MGAACTCHSFKTVSTRQNKVSGTSNGTVSQPGGSRSHAPRKRESGSSFTKNNKVFAANSQDTKRHHSITSQNSKEGILNSKDSGLHSDLPKTKVITTVNGSKTCVENSQAALGHGLKESFASVRHSSATPDLLNTSSLIDPFEIAHISSKPSSAGSQTSSSRLRRPPTKESRSVSISETDNSVQLNQYRLMDEIGKYEGSF